MNKDILSPLKAMRAKCLDCCCDNLKEVRECHINDCALWPYRFGKLPEGRKPKREYTEEQRKAMAERLAKARASQRADS